MAATGSQRAAPAAAGSSILAKGLSVTLGGVRVLRAISLAAGPGEFVGVIGPNGAGKSTLLRALAGLVRPGAGEVRICGLTIGAGAPARTARLVAYMPQRTEAHPFTALETVLMGRYPHLGRFELEADGDLEIALEAMRETETAHLRHRRLDALSGGERQRILMARVLAQRGRVLLLDEPTASLDLRHRLAAMELVLAEVRRREGLAVAALHDLFLAARYCDRLLLLADGELLADGPPVAVLTSENLRHAFGVEAAIERDPATGRPAVVLLGQANGPPAVRGAAGSAHLICGAGTGRALMHTLTAAGYRVTAGVLGQGDADRETAERLALVYVAAPPFAPIDDEAHARHIQLARAADCVVVTAMPVGSGNLRNLEAATVSRRLLLVRDGDFSDRDHTPDRSATALYAQLAGRAAEAAPEDVTAAIGRLLESVGTRGPAVR